MAGGGTGILLSDVANPRVHALVAEHRDILSEAWHEFLRP
jgi:hypothetical protein